MRAWRALKASGTAVLRDGVYLLPAVDGCHETLAAISEQAVKDGATSYLLKVETEDPESFRALFDRSTEFGELLADIKRERGGVSTASAAEAVKQARKLRKTLSQLVAIDYFPGEAQNQVRAALEGLEAQANRAITADEPAAVEGQIERLAVADYRGRIWATRARPWVDRLASAWLITRFIDPDATLQWIATPAECPPDALGFDFDGARFSHVGARVTFETLLDSFDLRTPPLNRVAALVHYLDAGGIEPPEASGVERILAGLRETEMNDDRLFNVAGSVFDGLLAAFVKEGSA
jgi:hypothetical protein